MKKFVVNVLLALVFFGSIAYLIVTPEPQDMSVEEYRQEYVQHMHEKEVMKAVQNDLYNK